MRIKFISVLGLLSVMGCGDEDATTTGLIETGTAPTETGTAPTETGTASTETGTTTATTETGTTTATTETSTTTTTSKFSPIEGVWRVMAMTIGKNGCGIVDDKEPGAFGVTNIDASSFLLKSMEDLDIHFKCTNTKTLKAYACTSVVMSDPKKSVDAVLNTTITPEVMFGGGFSAEMPINFTVDCVGADCPKVSAASGNVFPCLSEAVLSLQLGGS
jgi:hypothetical protein